MTIKITRFHKFQKGLLLGFLDISVPLWGTNLSIKGCKVFNKNGAQFVSLPSREYQSDDGETKYSPLIGIESEEVYKKFIKGVNDAWNEYCKEQGQEAQPQPVADDISDGVPF